MRERIRKMHAEPDKYALIKMVEELGLHKELTPELRHVLANFSPEVVSGIRAATLEMFDRNEEAMPMDCRVTPADLAAHKPVHVELVHGHHKRVIHVRPR